MFHLNLCHSSQLLKDLVPYCSERTLTFSLCLMKQETFSVNDDTHHISITEY